MKCESCEYDNKPDALVCNLCGANLVSKEEQPQEEEPAARPEIPDPDVREREETEQRWAKRRKDALKGYAVTGALTFFFLNTFFGLPGSLHPLTLILNVILSVLFGMPVGYLIGAKGGGLVRGAMVSSLFFALLRVLLALPAMVSSGRFTESLLSAVVGGILIGAIPGGIIGWHVELSE